MTAYLHPKTDSRPVRRISARNLPASAGRADPLFLHFLELIASRAEINAGRRTALSITLDLSLEEAEALFAYGTAREDFEQDDWGEEEPDREPDGEAMQKPWSGGGCDDDRGPVRQLDDINA